MEVLTQELEELIEKLKMAYKVYSRASEKIHDKPMTKHLRVIAARKELFLNDMAKVLDLDSDEIQVNAAERIKVQMEKLWIEIDNIILRLNEGQLLSFCMKREEELISIYQKLLENRSSLKKDLVELVQYQLNESNKTINQLKKIKVPYDYSKNRN